MKLIFAALMLLSLSSPAQRQIKQEANGNFVQVAQKEAKRDSITGATYTTAKGEVFIVYKSVRGNLYYWKTSKAGNKYKVYLKMEGDKK